MAAPSLNSTVIARLAQAAYGYKLGNATMNEALTAASTSNGGLAGFMNALYARDFGSLTPAEMAAVVVKNLGVPAAAVADATTYITDKLAVADPADRGAALIGITSFWSSLTTNAIVGTAVAQFNTDMARAVAYSQFGGTADVNLGGGLFTLDSSDAGIMRITGNIAARIDITRSDDQVTGLDLNRNGFIEFNGRENVDPTTADDGKTFTVIDAYARNPLNINDTANNYTAPISFDGTGFAGDGVKTNGNIFLGGLNADIALGGIGNDFFAGGGARAFNDLADGTSTGGQAGGDVLNGGRNADFAFAELSLLSPTDGNNTVFNGGTTADNTVAGAGTRGLGTQDNDTLLLEASDDDEPVTVNLGGDGAGLVADVVTASGRRMDLSSVEGVNASGNLYGFLNDFDVVIGARSYDGYGDAHTVGTENYGRGSTAQLIVNGNADNNLIIGGYDNDQINGGAGGDLLMGGDLRYLITNKNNPNLLDAKGGLDLTANSQGLVTDGRDNLDGGTGNDNIVFEADGGIIDGGADTGKTSGRSQDNVLVAGDGSDDRNYAGPRAPQGDTLWLTDFSMGRLVGATAAGEATAQTDAMSKLTTDSTFRIDLGGGAAFKNYGGAALSNAATVNSQDVTNYVATGTNSPRVTMTGIESVNATGLGGIDYLAAGTNSPEIKFNNQQNYSGTSVAMDLRGSGADNGLLASGGNDTVEGRGGDDVISAGAGDDRIVMAFGDGVDWQARPVDANGDSLWDTTGGLVVAGGVAWGQDFRPAAAATAGTTTLVVDFGSTVLDGTSTFVATFQVRVDGKDFGTAIPAATLAAAKTLAEVATIVNTEFQKIDSNVSVVVGAGNTIEVRAKDSTPADGVLPVMGTDAATGFFVTGQASGTGTYQAKGSILGLSGTNLEDDRLVIKSYEDRTVNLGLDQTKFETSQAADMVASFSSGSSILAEGQGMRLFLDQVREGDVITVTINEQPYTYTVKAGENAEAAAIGLRDAINNFLDINTSSGRVTATSSANSFNDELDLGGGQAGVLIQQAIVNGSQTYMNVTAAVSRTDGAATFGRIQTHNQSNTFTQILGFDGRNGALTSQDKAGTPVILFQGRNGDLTTTSTMLTAKNTGGTMTGTEANLSALDGDTNINGDDLLFGGDGNDIINALTGDDRIIMSKGTDTVDGGAGFEVVSTETIHQDVLQAEELTFGTGTRFTVTLDAALGAAGLGKGTIAAFKADGTATGDVTTFSNIELVRALENNRQSALDVKGLSDSVAAAAAGGPAGGVIVGTEGLTINLLVTPTTTYTVDTNNNGAISAGELNRLATAVQGIENVTTGNANDTINVDQTQATANNKFTMGDQQSNEVSLTEGADTVNYDHTAIAAASRPDVTVAVTGASAATVAITGGAVAKSVFTDTLTGVEVVGITNAAGVTGTKDDRGDTLDLSGVNGATVNFGGTGETVGKSLGGITTALTTVAMVEADTLESGGISTTGANLGNELLEIVGITRLETVKGSAGSDRVIVGNTLQSGLITGADAFESVAGNSTWFSSAAQTAMGIGGGTGAALSRNDVGLYTFDLGAGNDSLDYKQETDAVAVSVDTSATDTDEVYIGSLERADIAIGVERYYGGSAFGGADNVIDLVSATVDTTIQYSKEAQSNVPANAIAEPQGNDGGVTGETRGAELRETGTSNVFATFMDRTGANDIGVPASRWGWITGSNTKAETVILTDNEAGAFQILSLAGGKNAVDYSAMSSAVTANIGAVTRSTNTFQVQTTTFGNTGGDNARQAHNLDNANNFLTITGSTVAGDNANIAGLFLQSTAAVANKQSLSGANSGILARSVVNLGTGEIREDIHGQYLDVNGVLRSANFLTAISGFEDATGGANGDTLLGNGGVNGLDGAGGADILWGGRGTRPVGSANTGDTLTGGAGADWFVYTDETESPGGSVTGGEQSATVFGAGGVGDAAVIRSQDEVTDFTTGADKLVFVIGADSWDSVRVTASLASLAAPAGAVSAVDTTGLAAGTSSIDIPVTTTGAVAGQVQNYTINHAGATPVEADLVFRIQMTSGSDIVDAGLGQATTNLTDAATADDGLAAVFVYTDKNQSQGGGFDQIVNFRSGEDKIDLSFLRAVEWEARFGTTYDVGNNNVADAIEAFRTLPASPVAAFNADAPGLFVDTGGQFRAIALQTIATAGGNSTAVFIDVNADGDYTVGSDMVLSLVGVGALALGDVIFNNYDLLGLNNELPGFAANSDVGT